MDECKPLMHGGIGRSITHISQLEAGIHLIISFFYHRSSSPKALHVVSIDNHLHHFKRTDLRVCLADKA